MPRASPSPSSHRHVERPSGESMYGMSQNCAIGPMRNAETGLAASSTLCAKPKTRPWVRNGTTRWRIVCSAASAAGMTHRNRKIPTT